MLASLPTSVVHGAQKLGDGVGWQITTTPEPVRAKSPPRLTGSEVVASAEAHDKKSAQSCISARRRLRPRAGKPARSCRPPCGPAPSRPTRWGGRSSADETTSPSPTSVGRPANNRCAASVSATRCSLSAFIRQPAQARPRASRRSPGRHAGPACGTTAERTWRSRSCGARRCKPARTTLRRHHRHHRAQRLASGMRVRDQVRAAPALAA